MIVCTLLILAGQAGSAWWISRTVARGSVSERTVENIEHDVDLVRGNTAHLQDSLDELAPKAYADRRDREMAPYR
jgi:hypothetical protein